jgi:hypothetical protein
MKRLVASILCMSAIAASAGAAPASRFGIDFSVSPQVGLAYAGSFDPGFSGIALAVTPFYQSGMLRVEAGLEAGSSPLGWQVLAPLRAGVRFDLAPFTVEALAEAAPGIGLLRPSPLFLVGAGALARVTWNLGPRFGIGASAGVRWTGCPAYAGYTGAAYSVLDVPLSLGVRWAFPAPPR